MPAGLLRRTGSRITSPRVVNGLTTNHGMFEENPLSNQTITPTLTAADGDEAAAQLPTRLPTSFPLISPQLSEGSNYSDGCRASWGAASQSCADDVCSVDLLSNGTSIGGSSVSGTGCSLGGSSLHGFTCSSRGANSSIGGSCHYSGDCCNGLPASAVGFPPRLRLPPHATAAQKYGSLPRKSSLGAVAEQLDGSEIFCLPTDPTTPCQDSPIHILDPSEATSQQGALAQRLPSSDHASSLHETWGLASQGVIAGRTQEAPAPPSPGSISGSEPHLSLLGDARKVMCEQDCLGQAGAIVAQFDDVINRSSGLKLNFCKHSPEGTTGSAHPNDSPVVDGASREAVSAAHLHPRLGGSSNGGHTSSSSLQSSRVLAATTAAADSISEEATASPICFGVSTNGNLAQRPVPTFSPGTECVGDPVCVTTATRKATFVPISSPVSTAARPQTRSAMMSQNASQTAKRSSVTTSTQSQTAVRPPFNPYGKPSTKVAAALSTPAGTHIPSALAPRARTTSVGSGISGAAGRKQGTRPPRVSGQQSVQAGIPTATVGGPTQAGRRPTAPTSTISSQLNNASSAAAPAGPQRSGFSGSNRNSRLLRPPGSATATPSTLSPNGKKFVNTLSGMSRPAAAAAITSGSPGNAYRPLRPAVCRYSVDSSVCSDSISSIRQASNMLGPTEGPNGPRQQSQQRLPSKQQPHTPASPPTVCSPAETLPLLRRQFFVAPDGLFYPGQPPTPPVCGMEDIMPMASPIPAAIEGTCASMTTAAPRAVRGVRERRRQLDTAWPWTASGSPQLSGGEEMHMDEPPSANCRAQEDAIVRQCCSGSDVSGSSDTGDAFGLPAWAWRSVADLLSQSIETSNRREQQMQSPETERQPQQQLLSYAQNDPSLVPLRRLSGTPHRRRGPCAIASPLLQPHMLAGAGVHLNSAAVAPDELPKPSHHQRRPAMPNEDEEHNAVLLSRQAARRRYGLGSPTLAGQFVAGDGSLVAMASSSHSSDNEEPSKPLPVHDDAGGWEGAAGDAPSPGARLLPFSGSHVDALVFASLRLSNTSLGLTPGLLAEEEDTMEVAAEGSANGHCAHRLAAAAAAAAAALGVDGFSRYQLGRDSTFTEEGTVPWTLQECPDSPSADGSEDAYEPDDGTMHFPPMIAAAAACNDLSAMSSMQELCPKTIGSPEVLELSAVLSLLGAVKALLSTSSTNCATVADSIAPWDTIWAAALCVAGAMTAPVTKNTFVSRSLFAAAGMAAAMLLADNARVVQRQRDLVAARRSVSGLGKGVLRAGRGSLRESQHTRKSISAVAGWHIRASHRLPDTACTASDVQDTTSNKEHFVRSKRSRSVESAQNTEQYVDSDDPAVGCALSSAGNVPALVEPSPSSGPSSANGCTWNMETRKSLIRIATEAIDTCAEALSAMRAAGSDRAALRRLARACGVYAGLQLAASAEAGSDVLDLTSADWSVVQSLVQQRLSRPQGPAAQSSVNIASVTNVPATQYHIREAVPASSMEASAEAFGKAVDLRDGDRPGCGNGLRAELNHRLGPFPATIAADAAAAVLDSPVVQRRAAGTPQGIDGRTRVATTGTIPALPPQEDLIKSASLASPYVASYKGGSELSQHFDAAIAAAASEGAAVAFLTVDKSVNQQEKLAMLAGTHCLLASAASLPGSASFSVTAANAAAILCTFPAESSLVLEAYSSTSTRTAANEAAALEALVTRREEVLPIHALATAEDASLSLHTARAHQQLSDERNTSTDVCLAMEAANAMTVLHSTFGENVMKAFNAERDQLLRDVAMAVAADAALSIQAEPPCARAMASLWSQRQKLLDCIAGEAAADAAAIVRAAAGEEAAVAAYAADRQELLSLVSFTDGLHAAVAVHSSMSAISAVQDLLWERSLQLVTVAEVAAADSAIAVIAPGLEEAACHASTKRRDNLLAAAEVAARESRMTLYSSSAEEVALARLARARSVLMSLCFAVEAMDAATALRADAAEEAGAKAFACRRLQCRAAFVSTVAAATATAVRAATAEDAALEHLATSRQHELAEYTSSVAVDVKARASAAEAEEVAYERLHQERCALLARQTATEAASITNAVQAVATDAETLCVLAKERQGLKARHVDASVGTSDLVNAVAPGRALEMCALGFLELQKQRLSLFAAVLGTNLAAMVAAASANTYGDSAKERGGEDGHVFRSHIRCFPLRSVCGENENEWEFVDESARRKSRVLKSFPVNLTSGSISDGEEQDEDGCYVVIDQMI